MTSKGCRVQAAEMMRQARLLSLVIAMAMQGPSFAAASEPSPSASLDCQVLEAAASDLAPGEAVEASRSNDGPFLAEQLPYVAELLELSDADARVVQAKARADTVPYQAPCWAASVPPELDELGRRVAFTRPIFLSAEAAVFQMRRDEHDRGRTLTCVVRRGPSAWRAKCQQTLIWAR
jgi:hypothetical protein